MSLPFELPQVSTAKLIAGGIAALAVAIFVGLAFHWRSEMIERGEWRDQVVAVVQSEVPVDRRKAVTAKTAGDEIHWLGREYRTHKLALEKQSEQLVIAKGKTEAAQNSAALAAKRALDADKPRKAIRDRLTAPSRSGGLTADEWSQL